MLTDSSLASLQSSLASGALSARRLTELYLERIDQLDRRGPALNAVIELNPDALHIADALDAERQARGPRGPLHGLPVLLKDNIDTADRMLTTAGSLALDGCRAAQEAEVARRLRQAGAVILGKTNLSEWANFRAEHSASGWSSRGGQTRNPYALDRNPSGSSSGSAVAVAASLCAAAVGTETDGSIVSPAQANGIAGLKPTVGLVSRAGIIPISHSQDTAGPMARSVADLALLLGALAGPDPRDPASAAAQGQSHADYTTFLDPNGLRGARLGVARNFFGFDARVDRLMETCLDVLKQRGAELVDPASVELPPGADEAEFEVLLHEFKAGLNRYLGQLGPDAQVHSLRDVIEFNERHARQVMPYFGQEVMLKAEARGPLTSEAYLKALETCRRVARTEGLDRVLAQHRLDALVAPTGGPAWLTDYVTGDHHSGGSSSLAAVAGYPSLTVPAGQVFGLPVGLSFIGGAFQEPTLLRLAYAFEQAHPARRPPLYLASVDLGPQP